MNFEVTFSLEGKELARYLFPVETPTDIEAGVAYALGAFRREKPEIDLLGDGLFIQVQKADR